MFWTRECFNFRRTWPRSLRATWRMPGGSCRSFPRARRRSSTAWTWPEALPAAALLALDGRPAIVTCRTARGEEASRNPEEYRGPPAAYDRSDRGRRAVERPALPAENFPTDSGSSFSPLPLLAAAGLGEPARDHARRGGGRSARGRRGGLTGEPRDRGRQSGRMAPRCPCFRWDPRALRGGCSRLSSVRRSSTARSSGGRRRDSLLWPIFSRPMRSTGPVRSRPSSASSARTSRIRSLRFFTTRSFVHAIFLSYLPLPLADFDRSATGLEFVLLPRLLRDLA